jgi:hypothetical protein
MDFNKIKSCPTSFKDERDEKRHESLLRSYHILVYVTDTLQRHVDNDTQVDMVMLLKVIEDLKMAGDKELDLYS